MVQLYRETEVKDYRPVCPDLSSRSLLVKTPKALHTHDRGETSRLEITSITLGVKSVLYCYANVDVNSCQLSELVLVR